MAIEGLTGQELDATRRLKDACTSLRGEIGKIIVGMERVVDEVLIAVFARGHALLVGVPGLAKTLLVRSLAESLSLSFKRIQFTPDLMPADITGTEVIQEDKATGAREFRFLPGPIFSNVLLADEINRTPPKTQAALLETMQEHQVTIGGKRYPIEEPFFVLATQNPIEQEGTYPLPEAQLDRFMFMIHVGYPGRGEELEILERTTTGYTWKLEPVLSGKEIIDLQEIVHRVGLGADVKPYILSLVRATRPHEPEAPDFVNQWISWGAGPRASQYLVLGAKARALLDGRGEATLEDVDAIAAPVLRHRVITNFNAEAEGQTPDRLVDRLLEHAKSAAAVG